MRFFAVALGGAIGTLLRYLIGELNLKFFEGLFPISILVINVTGSLVIGFLWGLVDRFSISPNMRVFVFTGILGGYTTFSAFTLETFNLLRGGEYRIALTNAVLSVVLGVSAVFLGYLFSKTLVQ